MWSRSLTKQSSLDGMPGLINAHQISSLPLVLLGVREES